MGVEEDAICLDWEKTAFHVPELSRLDHPSRYDRMLECFNAFPGENLSDKAEHYVLSLGFSPAEIRVFREAMLVPALKVRKLQVDVGRPNPFTVLHVSDSHVAYLGKGEDEGVRRFAAARSGLGRDLGGHYLDEAIGYAEKLGEMVVHTGDLMEFASAANEEFAARTLKRRNVLACVGNHEFWTAAKTGSHWR